MKFCTICRGHIKTGLTKGLEGEKKHYAMEGVTSSMCSWHIDAYLVCSRANAVELKHVMDGQLDDTFATKRSKVQLESQVSPLSIHERV